MFKIKPILIVLALLAAGVAATALADYDFEGTANGDEIQSEIIPFVPWLGTINTTYNTFSGYWGNDPDNWMIANLSYNQQTGVYTIIEDDENVWAWQNVPFGYWTGYFDPGIPNDTADGDWWTFRPYTADGSWWGDRADD